MSRPLNANMRKITEMNETACVGKRRKDEEDHETVHLKNEPTSSTTTCNMDEQVSVIVDYGESSPTVQPFVFGNNISDWSFSPWLLKTGQKLDRPGAF